MQFIVSINCNSEIRLRRVKCSQASVKYALCACEIRPLGELRKETLRVSIQLKFKWTEPKVLHLNLPEGQISHSLASISHALQRIFHARKRISFGFSAQR